MDCIRKDYQRGEARWSSKLTESDVREIVQLMKTPCPCCGRLPIMKTVGAKFGVSAVMVCNIVNGKGWKHVTDPDSATPHPAEGAI